MWEYVNLDVYFFFFFNDTATTEIYTLSLHDALPICECEDLGVGGFGIPAAETLESGLRALSAVARLGAENRTQIGIFRDSARLVRGQVGAADRNRIFGPQAEF